MNTLDRLNVKWPVCADISNGPKISVLKTHWIGPAGSRMEVVLMIYSGLARP